MDQARLGKYAVRGSILVLVALCLPVTAVGLEIEPWPGAEKVASHQDAETAKRSIVLGSLKKINNVLEPEAVEEIQGTLDSITWYLPGERRVDRVYDYYRQRLDRAGQILFECRGRGCGSSQYWADSVFKLPVLYGPEQFQRYLVGRVAGTGETIVVYIGQRGTRKIYVHQQVITPVARERSEERAVIRAALQSHGQYVVPLPAAGVPEPPVLDSITSALQDLSPLRIHLVVHSPLKSAETVDQGLERTRQLAERIRTLLVDRGAGPQELFSWGVGPLAPHVSEPAFRLELLVID